MRLHLSIEDPGGPGAKEAYVNTEADGLRLLTEWKALRQKGLLTNNKALTVSAYLEQWLASKRDIRPKTQVDYERVVRAFLSPILGRLQFEGLRPLHIRKLHDQMLGEGRSPTVVRRAHVILGIALNEAVSLEILSRNVASAVSPPRVAHKPLEIWTLNEVRSILRAAQGKWIHPLLVLAVASGLANSWPLAGLGGLGP